MRFEGGRWTAQLHEHRDIDQSDNYSQKGLQFYQTRLHAIALFNTLLSICIEKVVYMKIREDFSAKYVNHQGLHHGRQDPPNLEARKSDRPSKRTKREVRGNSSLTSRGHTSQTSRRKSQSEDKETCRGHVDCRIQGIPPAMDQKKDIDRQRNRKKTGSTVRESHPNRESYIKDLNKTEEFNPFSEKSKKLITSMGNTEYFELRDLF